jgi:hypothetical protein
MVLKEEGVSPVSDIYSAPSQQVDPTCCEGALYTSETGDNFSLKERIRNKKICLI